MTTRARVGNRQHEPKHAKRPLRKAYSFASLLYTQPSFLRGVACVLDLGGALHDFNYSPTPWHADYYALLSDHRAIVADCRAELPKFLPSQRIKR